MHEELVWDKVLIARHAKRPTTKKIIDYLVDDFIELHGDRHYGDDYAIISGIGFLNDLPITIIGQEKGETTPEKLKHNFGMPHPEGYRKALRLMKQAEKFNRPILSIIDTPGAYPGIGAEERGQANAIAKNLMTMIDLKVPIISVVLGEGGSGGALAIGVSDEIWMFENAIYSVLSPEGFATILYKDVTLAKKCAGIMKLTAHDLFKLKVIEKIIPEYDGGLHRETERSLKFLKTKLIDKYKELREIDVELLCETRYSKYRDIGIYAEK